jgi:hypothetical protein
MNDLPEGKVQRQYYKEWPNWRKSTKDNSTMNNLTEGKVQKTILLGMT